jgi:hypothetical protein
MKAPKNKIPDAEGKKKMPKLPERGDRTKTHQDKKPKRSGY